MNKIINLPLDGTNGFACVQEIGPRCQRIYSVLFSNEYQNIFYKDVESGEWIEEDLGYTELAARLGTAITNVTENSIHVPKLLIWHTESDSNTNFTFGFTSLMEHDQRQYEIYGGNKKYLFTLAESEEDNWQILGNSGLINGKLDPEFVFRIVDALAIYMD